MFQVGFAEYLEVLINYLLICDNIMFLQDCLAINDCYKVLLLQLSLNSMSSRTTAREKYCLVFFKILCDIWSTLCDDVVAFAVTNFIFEMRLILLKNSINKQEYNTISNRIIFGPVSRCLSLACLQVKTMPFLSLWGINLGFCDIVITSQLQVWLKHVKYSCKTRASEPLRLSVAESISLAGGNLILWIKERFSIADEASYVELYFN